MKKSEVLGKIWSVLYQKTDLEEQGLRLLAEDLLEEIEDMGMLPPNTNDHRLLDGSSILFGQCNQWDEE